MIPDMQIVSIDRRRCLECSGVRGKTVSNGERSLKEMSGSNRHMTAYDEQKVAYERMSPVARRTEKVRLAMAMAVLEQVIAQEEAERQTNTASNAVTVSEGSSRGSTSNTPTQRSVPENPSQVLVRQQTRKRKSTSVNRRNENAGDPPGPSSGPTYNFSFNLNLSKDN